MNNIREIASNSSVNYFNLLMLRELGNNWNRTRLNERNIRYRDYHMHQYSFCNSTIRHIVIADDVICVIYGETNLVSFERYTTDGNGELQACTTKVDNRTTMICHRFNGDCQFVCYNDNNNSLIMVMDTPECLRIISPKLKCIKSDEAIAMDSVQIPTEHVFHSWGFDISNCTGMIYNKDDKVYTFFELKHYTGLFTIHDLSLTSRLVMIFQNQPNSEMVGFRIPHDFTPRSSWRRDEINSFTICSTMDPLFVRQVDLPDSMPISWFEFIILCGADTIVMQQHGHGIQILDIAANIGRVIEEPGFKAIGTPYFLNNRRLFICQTNEYTVEVINLRGERAFTLIDGALRGERIPLEIYSYDFIITKEEDFCICHSFLGDSKCISIHNIETGETIFQKSTPPDSLTPFAYDEKTSDIFIARLYSTLCVMSNKFYNDAVVQM